MMGAQNFDTVAEVQVLTTNYQAEYGRSSAGQLRLVTKSGTQSFRGNVFWSHQNDALDANTWTRKRAGLEKSPHKYNAYGFTLGGPIYIPGAFNASKSAAVLLLGPGVAARSHGRGADWRSCRRRRCATATSARSLPGRVIRDPLTGLPFPGNVIPSKPISPQGQALLNAYPLPTPGFQQGANNWIGNPSVFNNQRKDSIKIDWVPTSNHRVAVRHTWAPNVWNDPEPMGVYSTIWDYPGRTLAATLTSTLSIVADQRVLVLVGLDEPVEVLRAAQLRLLPGRHRRVSLSHAERGRHQLSVPLPGNEARSGQDSRMSR